MNAPAPSLPRLAAVTLLVALLALAASLFLVELKFAALLDSAARTRLAVPLLSVRDALQGPLAQGLPLAGGAALDELLAREARADAAIAELAVLDANGQPLARRSDGRSGERRLTQELHNAFGLPLGSVRLSYRLDGERAAQARLRGQLLNAAGGAALLAGLAGALGLLAARRRAALALPALLVGLLLGLGLFAAIGLPAYQQGLAAQLERKAAVVGQSLQGLVGKAQGLGLALDELVGVDAQFQTLRREHRELGHLALLDAQGSLLVASGTPGPGLRLALAGGGAIEVAVAAEFLRASLHEALLDLAVVLVVVGFLARELLRAALPRPAGGGAQALQRLRAPLLLFMLAEELTRAFLPGFALGLSAGSAQAAGLAGLPIVVFMAVVAAGQLPLAAWAERVGLRLAFALGVFVAALSLAGAAQAGSLAGFVAWRALSGLGWALVFVAAQGVVVANSGPAERPRAFADFVSAILVAGVCGPPLGGLIADQLGPRAALLTAAALALLAGLALTGLPRQAVQAAAPTALREALGALLREPRFRDLALLAALPAKLILAGLCFYLLPLHLQALGAPAASVGRAQMLYALALLAMLPLAAGLAERGGEAAQRRLVGGGLCLSALGALGLGAALLLGWQPAPEPSVYAALALLGAGQGLAIAAQSSLLAPWCAQPLQRWGAGALFGLYRLLERLGNALGPLLAGALLIGVGQGGALAAIGALVLGCGLLFLWRTRGSAR